MLWGTKAAQTFHQTPENPRVPPKTIGENSPGSCSQTPIPLSLRSRGGGGMEGKQRMGSLITQSAALPQQDWGSGGLGQALLPQLHHEGVTPSSPQLLKAGYSPEHPTRILTTDTPYSHLFQELPLRLFPTPQSWNWLALPQKSPKIRIGRLSPSTALPEAGVALT